MSANAEDSRVSDIWDSRMMMSSEQTETEVFGLFPKKQHIPPPNSHALTIFASSSLIKWKKSSFSTELHHIISSAVVK